VGLHQCRSERKGDGARVRSPNVPSHVPGHMQTAAKVRGFSPAPPGCTAEIDSPLEGGVYCELVSESEISGVSISVRFWAILVS
jgi:hypothetical protein